ncbi:MAG: TonB-dependent receptor [Saprospiraceae bacterium]|nr:TonB-dependent receptor [Saprospiraceae bacterium]
MKQTLLTLLLVFGAAMAFAQTRTIKGKILDAGSGEPLIGATILAKGTSAGTISDVDGNYSLSLPSGANTLVVSFTGYATLEVAVGASNVVDITMATDQVSLSEVVVVGYGTQIKSTLTGNIAKLDGDKLKDLPIVSMEQGIQGKTAGVFVESVNGKPGGAVRVRIRGAASITASNQPLYIVDGIPISVDAQNSSGASLNPLADLNPNDIESVEILKDASAGAIYGSRAANGVVLITTKTGRSGKTYIEANFQTGTSQPTGKREFLDRDEYTQLFLRSAEGAARYEYALDPDAWGGNEQDAIDWYTEYVKGRLNRYSGPDVTDYTTTNTNTNWQDQLFADKPVSTQASLSASGGNERTKYYAAAAWNRQEGVLKGNNFERMSARLNLDQQATERINFGVNMSLARTFTDQVSDDNAFSTPMQLVALSPLTPMRDEDGVLYDRPTTTYYNGLIDMEEANRDVTTFRSLANGYARWKLMDGLLLNGELGTDVWTLRDNAFYGSRTDAGNASNGFGSSVYAQTVNLTPKAFLNYDKSFGVHNLGLTLGTEYQHSRTDRTIVEGGEFPVDDLKTLASAANITLGSSTITEFSFLSYFARANYDFDRKYLLSASARIDGSSRFGSNSRYGFFPSISAGWVLSEEDFLVDNSLISFLKLRASYGKTGNAAIGNFRHLGLYDAAAYGGQSGLSPSQIPNPDLEWEKTAQTDFGIDFGMFNNRLSGEIDYYIKNTTDLLLDVPVPSTSGFRTQTQNVGEVENKGWEFVLNSNNLVGDFKWNTSFNIAINKNNVVSLSEGQDLIDDGNTNVVKVGESIGAFYGAEYAGVDPANGDAIWYKNGEGTGRETTNDYAEAEFVVIGNPNPDFIGGITNSFSWKGLSLDIMFQGVYGNEIYKDGDRFMACQGCWFDNQTTDQLDHWNQPGDVVSVPEPRFWYQNGDQTRNSRYIADGSYLRLKTLTIGYELPKSVLERLGISRTRLYVIGQNLLTFTKYDGWDPEVSSDAFTNNIVSGVDFYSAPQPKVIAFGISVGF